MADGFFGMENSLVWPPDEYSGGTGIVHIRRNPWVGLELHNLQQPVT
jgi:hypothetical protein